VEALAARMSRVLDHPMEAVTLGSQGREHVRKYFLLPELVKRYLTLLQFYTGVSREMPEFRLDGLAYSEVMDSYRTLRIRHSHLQDPSSVARARECI